MMAAQAIQKDESSSLDPVGHGRPLEPVPPAHGMRYSEVQFLHRGEKIAPEALPKIMIAVEDLCGDYS